MASLVSALTRDELEARLYEAEETLRAIREGEIDAVVIKGGATEQVFTLEGDGHSYRTFMEAMDIGAAAFDAEGQLLYANQALHKLLDLPSGALSGQALIAILDAVNQTTFRRLLTQAMKDRQSSEIHVRVGDSERSFLLTGAPIDFGIVRGVAVTFTDISEREQIAAAKESERLARSVLASANEAVIVCDRSGTVTHINAAAERICAEAPIGKPFGEAIELTFADAAELMSGADIVTMAASGTPVQGLEAAVKTSAVDVTDVMISAAPLVVSGERTQGCVVTLINLSQRKAAERRQALLMGELDHRVKNTLAMVLAISARTASHERTIEDFQKSFSRPHPGARRDPHAAVQCVLGEPPDQGRASRRACTLCNALQWAHHDGGIGRLHRFQDGRLARAGVPRTDHQRGEIRRAFDPIRQAVGAADRPARRWRPADRVGGARWASGYAADGIGLWADLDLAQSWQRSQRRHQARVPSDRRGLPNRDSEIRPLRRMNLAAG
ncbi:PAS domain S-box-containing protein [Bradyrhizobium yuanmingense]